MSDLIMLDTNVLIAISKRQFDPRSLHAQYSRILVSFVAYTEALGFNFLNPNEESRMQALLDSVEKIPFGAAEAYYAVSYRKLKKIKFPDAAILATARAAGADLLTQNTADFRGLDAAVRVLTIEEL
jgi:predicted nucleic acid-binding protein